MNEFPKALYLNGNPSSDVVFVKNEKEQTEALEKGYKVIKDAALPQPAEGNGITPDLNATQVTNPVKEGDKGVEGARIAHEEAEAFLAQKVADAKAQLGKLTDEQLDAYRAVEVRGENRPTLLAAIDAEIQKRAESRK